MRASDVRGLLVYAPLSAVQRQAELVFAAFRERILSFPGKIAAICEMRSRIEVEEIVRSECCEVLEELSRPIMPMDGKAMSPTTPSRPVAIRR